MINKLIMSILLFLIPFSVLGQELTFHGKNKNNSNYPYEYWFSLKDTSCVVIKKVSNDHFGVSSIRGIVVNDLIPEMLKIRVLDSGGNIVFNSELDSIGNFTIISKLENFVLHFLSISHDDLFIKINLKPNESLNLKIRLVERQDPIVYQINSKRKLKPEEIKQIMNCVINSFYDKCDKKDSNFLEKCEFLGLFRFTIHL